MEQDTTNLPGNISPRPGSHLPRCPVIRVLRANDFGMIVESSRGFEVGEQITIGFLVDDCEPNSFISAESLVVESQRTSWVRGEFRHQVTLLFSKIASEDRSKLIRLSKSIPSIPRPPKTMGLN